MLQYAAGEGLPRHEMIRGAAKSLHVRPIPALLLAVCYFLAAKGGLSLALVHANATAVWPPTGLSLAAVLLLGPGVWPGIFLGAFFANLTTAGSIATSCAIAVGNLLEALVGAWLVRRFAGGLGAFDVAKRFVVYVLLAGLLAPTISATLGVTSLSIAGFAQWSRYPSIWLTWWLGDVVSNLTVAPALLLWLTAPRSRLTPRRALEGAVLLGTVALVTPAVFGWWEPVASWHYPLSFLTLPPLLWAAFRFGRRAAVTVALLMSCMAIVGTLRGLGPFAVHDPNTSLLLLQAFMGTVTITGLALATLETERGRAEEQIRASLREKEVLLREIYHRVKNNLQVISSLLSLQAHEIRDPQVVQMFVESQHRIRSMALVHESLYSSSTLSRIEMRPYIKRLTEQLVKSYATNRRVRVRLEVDELWMLIDRAIPCGLVLNKLVSNALKHAFPDGRSGEVVVGLRRQEGLRVLSVHDSGVGLPADVDVAHAQSLGLRLVQALTEQLGGRLAIERPGARFTVTWPEESPELLPEGAGS